jgi:hypothetical protein
MRVTLQIARHGECIYTGVYDIKDAESFSRACADAWAKIRQQQMEKETSIGALMEHLPTSVLDQLIGSQISLEKA